MAYRMLMKGMLMGGADLDTAMLASDITVQSEFAQGIERGEIT